MALPESKRLRIQQLASIGIALACWALLSAAFAAGLFQTFDERLRDWRFRLRGERQATDSIAILSIDDTTIRRYGGSWPLPRNTYALLLTALEDAGARSIGFDIILRPNAALNPKLDDLLAYVSSQYSNVAHAVSFHLDASDSTEEEEENPDAEVLAALHRNGVVAPVPAAEAVSVSLPYPGLALHGNALGHVTVLADPDGAIRRQPLLARYEDRVYPALAVRLIGLAKGHQDPPEVRAAGSDVSLGWPDARWVYRPDRDGATAIDFAGDRGAFLNRHSMLEVLQRHVKNDRAWLRRAFSNRIVLIGLDSREEATEDVGTTPFAAATPLLFVHANMLDNLLRGRFLRQAPTGPYLAALAILAVFLGWVFSIQSVPRSALIATLAVTVVAGIDFMLFAGWAIDAPPLAALALAPVICVATGGFRYVFLERRNRQREAELKEGRIVQQELLPESLIGQTLSHYQILAKLGGGGMGVVYLGRDTRLNRDVAIKVLPGRSLANDHARKRFRREAMALSRLSHPHIAGIHDFDNQDGVDFIAMEFVAGSSLLERIRRGSLSERESIVIAIQVAEALVEAHEHGVIHRDLKPANVVLTPRGEAKVLDFGLARLVRQASDAETVTDSLTEKNQIMGTLAYMSPEALQGEAVDGRTDVYSLGVMLYEMLTGQRPFHDDNSRELYFTILNLAPTAPSVLNAGISPGTEGLVLRAIEKEASRRPQSARDMLLDLRELAARSGQGLLR